MTKSSDLAQTGEEAKRVMPHRLDLGFAPSEAYLELYKQWLAKIEPDIKFAAVIHATAGLGKSSLVKRLNELAFEFGETQTRLPDEPLFRVFSEMRSALPTAERVGEEALRARVSELERKLAEAENLNRVQRSRLSEERRAAATANRINDQLQQRLDQLQQRLDRQLDFINERARANDVALAALDAKAQGRLLTYEALQGEAIEISEAEVVVRFDTGDDIVEQTYDLRQFTLGKTPAVGDQLAVYVHVALVASAPLVPATESKGRVYESPRPRRNVITGDHRF